MGSGPSRGKKVAPARASEGTVAGAAAGVTSAERDSRPLRPPQGRAQPDRHSEGPDSDLSGEDDDDADGGGGGVVGGPDAVLAGGLSAERPPAKKSFVKSKTYGLCHLGRADAEDEGSRAEEPRGPRGASEDVNKRRNDAFTRPQKRTCSSQRSSLVTRGAPLDAVPASEKQSTFGSCHRSSLTTPVILYDGSEEELMDTIEREFS
ncbi:cystin-1 [Scophthalmus maximus]|uniref:cystin-1 n=1 Tax=Scophthalmus maximus TaxID=52904 RepID=UPI001FA847A0|nr:cystin-1 [Scophthalmus maximus]